MLVGWYPGRITLILSLLCVLAQVTIYASLQEEPITQVVLAFWVLVVALPLSALAPVNVGRWKRELGTTSA